MKHPHMTMLQIGGREIPAPGRMARLHRDKHGHPVPWFVAWLDDGEPVEPPDGQPEFRVIGPGKRESAMNHRLCWTCGQPRGRYGAFLIGPMCAVNRVTAEPPCDRECAVFSARACPFLIRPQMRRRERGLPENTGEPGGVMLRRNPGVACVWITRDWGVKFFTQQEWLIKLGDPSEVLWYAEGRPATRAEALASIDSGMDELLRPEAEAEGKASVRMLDRQYRSAMRWLPA